MGKSGHVLLDGGGFLLYFRRVQQRRGLLCNNEKFGFLYGKHINIVGCEEKGL